MCMLHNDFSHVCSGKPARFSLIICGRFTVKLTVKLTKPHSCSAGASQTCDRSSAPQPMPTARRSAAELVSLTVSITRQRPEDLTAGEKKKAIRHAPTIWATMYERIRPYTTVYDRIRPNARRYGMHRVSIPYPKSAVFLFAGGFLPYPAKRNSKFLKKGLTNSGRCAMMFSGTHN